jgi:XTP/dITP diphosphohydrolase
LTEEGLLLATTNQDKIRELKARLQSLSLDIFSLRELRITRIFPEKGQTFLENARGKSLYYSQYWKNLTLAEDSGLEIDYLDGAPGVYSSRFAGPDATDEANLQKVLQLLSRIPQEERKARFISCMVLSRRGQIIAEIQGHAQGFITSEKKGQSGFGYDPIFFYPPLGKTFAELSPDEKNEVSHRGHALEKLCTFLHEYLKSQKTCSNKKRI